MNEKKPSLTQVLWDWGKAIFSTISTAISHTATYGTLQSLRKQMTAKLVRVPMGTILDTPSGQYKTTIVDRVVGMEPTLYSTMRKSNSAEHTRSWLHSLVFMQILYLQSRRQSAGRSVQIKYPLRSRMLLL